MEDLSKLVKPQPSDPVRELPGQYRDDTDSIPEADRFQGSTMPQGPEPNPFKLGPTSAGE